MKNLFATFLLVFAQNVFALEIGDPAPAANLKALKQGIESQVSVQAPTKMGQKVLLEFFQTNCSFCRENLPNVINAEKEGGDKVVVRHIGIDRSEADLRKFAADHLDLMIVLDNNRIAKKAFEIRGTPTTYIVDGEGKIAYRHEGVWEDSEKVKIREILAQ